MDMEAACKFELVEDYSGAASFRNAGFFEHVGTLHELQWFDLDLVFTLSLGHPIDRSHDGRLANLGPFVWSSSVIDWQWVQHGFLKHQ